MGDIKEPQNVLFILVAYSRYKQALSWSIEQFTKRFGAPHLISPELPFNETSYYTASMGADLLLQMSAYKLISPFELAQLKHFSNKLEATYKADHNFPEERPLNLDPGYLNAHKFVLATTKDADHRLYLTDGIYAESTLHYLKNNWQDWPWTYANYRRTDHKEFLQACRKLYLEQAKKDKLC